MSAEGEILLPQDSYDGLDRDEVDDDDSMTPPSDTRKHHIEEDDNNYNKSYPVQTDKHHPRGSPSIPQGLHPNPSPEMDRYPSMMSMSGQGSWYFQPHPSQNMNGEVPSGDLPPHLAYWMQQNPNPNHYNGGQYGRDVSDVSGSYQFSRNTSYDSPYPEHPLQQRQHQNQQQPDLSHLLPDEDEYKVYSTRWIMLTYMSILNLLSDWTCYSIAPIAILTQEAFGDVDPESLVTVFLGANAVASAFEPMVLGRLGLRRTVLLGSLLLMIGSIVKSGGLQSLIMAKSSTKTEEEEDANETWRIYLGFLLVGLSQPLYQCTPALLSASWFPENERTMATGVALNSNQLGIGCAFVFGTMLVSTQEDIMPYFGLLSVISTLTFIGTALQFDDAPPTPPSDTARVIKGDLEIKIPKFIPFIGGYGHRKPTSGVNETKNKESKTEDASPVTPGAESTEAEKLVGEQMLSPKSLVGSGPPTPPSSPPGNQPSSPPPESHMHKKQKSGEGIPNVHFPEEPVTLMAEPNHPLSAGNTPSPSPFMPGPPPPGGFYPAYPPVSPGMEYSTTTPSFYHGYDQQGHYHNALLENARNVPGYNNEYDDSDYWQSDDEGVEPIMTQMDHQLDIDIRDDQLIQQVKACFRRKGFVHCVVAFTTSGIIVNTLSTFMDYLVTLNGAPHKYVGIVGGTFQALIMCSSLLFGGWTDHSRKYYFVILAMLVLGAFALSICNIDLDGGLGGDLRLNLLVVAVLAGPLQPISTELGVEVVYPLSENTVLVIQQLFSNLLSAAFIPVFKALRKVGTVRTFGGMDTVPEYTFSFYMLIIIHATSCIFFATFNGTYLRYEAEESKKAKKEEERAKLLSDLQQKHGYGSVSQACN